MGVYGPSAAPRPISTSSVGSTSGARQPMRRRLLSARRPPRAADAVHAVDERVLELVLARAEQAQAEARPRVRDRAHEAREGRHPRRLREHAVARGVDDAGVRGRHAAEADTVLGAVLEARDEPGRAQVGVRLRPNRRLEVARVVVREHRQAAVREGLVPGADRALVERVVTGGGSTTPAAPWSRAASVR